MGESSLAGLLVGALAGYVVAPLVSVLTTRPPLLDTDDPPRLPFRCDTCKRPLSTIEALPIVSWITRRGRCGGPTGCGSAISRWDIAAEVGTILAGAFVGWRIGAAAELAAFLVFAFVAVSVVLVDARMHKIATKLVYPAVGVSLVLLAIAAVANNRTDDLVRAVLAGLAASGFFWILILVVPAGMGDGDARLAMLLGLFLGWHGWTHVYIGLMAGFLFGSIAGIVLMIARRAGRKSMIAFGPYLVAGGLLVSLYPSIADRFLPV